MAEATETETGAAEAESQPDLGALVSGFESFTGEVKSSLGEISERIGALEQGYDEGEGDGEGGEAAYDLSQMAGQQAGQQQEATPEQALQALQAFIDQQVQAGVKTGLTEHQQQQAAVALEQTRDAYADQLEEKIPELADEKVQQHYVDKTVEFAKLLGRPELAGDPRLLEQLYWADKAQVGAADGGAQEDDHLETGGAASTATGGEKDVGDGIVAAAQRRRF